MQSNWTPGLKAHTRASEPRGFQPTPGSQPGKTGLLDPTAHSATFTVLSCWPAPFKPLCLPLDLKHEEPATLMIAPGWTPTTRYQDPGNFSAGDADYSRVTFFFFLFLNMSEITVLPERQSKLSDIILGNITVQLQSWSRLLLLLF